ncbi:GTP cyclohydrolase II RibA [Pseudovibrio sp. Ad37]|uniref:GTP cyclohydrolase II RibA n=1 Tax=Pseudovibrio sp. Ad37 TaxID=989422 RepID=UPI0007AEB0F4|nr:GTP cyclohydrolase II RibA [Pseudovibrio sp. Ad37]KZL15101.1 Riboflavin biosynthesis protein RibBA [Pseudovibrio sp. Ad37]
MTNLASVVHDQELVDNADEMEVRSDVLIDLDGLDSERVRFISFKGAGYDEEHFAVIFGDPEVATNPFVRVHSECITGDLFGSKRCDCGAQLAEFIEQMKYNDGVLIYLRQEGRGIGLYSKLEAYLLQDAGQDTFEANRSLDFPEDGRDFLIAAKMLKALNIKRFSLVTNNPEKVSTLSRAQLEITEVKQTATHVTTQNIKYLMAKRDKGHSLDELEVILHAH